MKIGVNVINFGNASADNLRGWARFIEDTGFHAALVSDHVTVTPDVAEQYPAPFYDPLSTLAWFAGITERIELGTTVSVLPYRSPLQTARVVANIDRFSDGRVILGVGVGWAKHEFDALNVPFDQRGPMTDEYLTAITELWTRDVASMEGEYVTFHDVSTAPRPIRAPHPPIWIGGNSRAAIRRSVVHGTVWHPIYPDVAWLREKGLPALVTEAESRDRRLPGLAPRILLRVTEEPLDEARRRSGEGSLPQIRSDLHAFAELGAEYVVLDTYRGHPDQLVPPEQDWRMLETLADEVLDLPGEGLR